MYQPFDGCDKRYFEEFAHGQYLLFQGVSLVLSNIIPRFCQFDRGVFCLIGKIKNAFQLLSEMRYGNVSAQTRSSVHKKMPDRPRVWHPPTFLEALCLSDRQNKLCWVGHQHCKVSKYHHGSEQSNSVTAIFYVSCHGSPLSQLVQGFLV